ncbi:MAG TPA: lysophospholipid acyltransferase family protein [Verrucomicrobiae bacterium]
MSAAKPIPPRKSGVVVPQKPKWHGRLAARLIYGLTQIVAATTRFRWEDNSGLMKPGDKNQAIYSIWHNRLAYSLVIYQRYVREHTGRELASLVSASKDGGLLARVLELFGTRPVRGSSSRRGPQALREMVSAAEDGCVLAITPDGPRGPCYQVQEGIIGLAQVTELPIIPVSYHLSFKFRIKSWDRFQVPLPFGTCTVKFGEPITIPREAGEKEREQLRAELQRRMLELNGNDE